jgi:hypothetical protein
MMEHLSQSTAMASPSAATNAIASSSHPTPFAISHDRNGNAGPVHSSSQVPRSIAQLGAAMWVTKDGKPHGSETR